MSTTNRDICVESALPVVSSNGLNTNMAIDFSNAPTAAFPSATTIGGSSVVALASVTGTQTSGATFSVTNTGVYAGVGAVQVIGDSATTGVVSLTTGNGLTTGTVASFTSTGTIITTGKVINYAANTATTSTGLLRGSGTGLTDGWVAQFTSGGANLTASGGGVDIVLGANTLGTGIRVVSTGVMVTTSAIAKFTADSATTAAGLVRVSGLGLTSGLGHVVTATAATLTTGRYYSANDAAGEVFGIGANGHIHSTVGATAPTIAVTTQAGITAAAITAGGSDTCGVITTTGTSTGATILTVTFNKTYTTAPKTVILTPANASAGMPNTGYIVDTITATTFRIIVAAGGIYAATPSFYYLVIA